MECWEIMPFIALFTKEVRRFMSRWPETILGSVFTAVLFQIIFGAQFAHIKTGSANFNYFIFLVPGLIIMQILLNSFAQGSSSLLQSKYTGNIIFILMAPISPVCVYFAYLLASVVRGLLVGIVIFICMSLFQGIMTYSPLVMAFFGIMGALITGGLGVIAGILCDKFEQLGSFQMFVILPLIYLSGVFFNVEHLQVPWKFIVKMDPFFYMVYGFRYGFIGGPKSHLCISIIFISICAMLINFIGIMLLKRKLKFKV